MTIFSNKDKSPDIHMLQEQDFLGRLADILNAENMCNVDLQARVNGLHTQYGTFVHDYDICCMRTPVWRPGGMFRRGEWLLIPGEFERYELYASQRGAPHRDEDQDDSPIPHHFSHAHHAPDTNNQPKSMSVFMNAAMASGAGYYNTYASDPRPQSMFFYENAELFPMMQKIFAVMDKEAKRRNAVVHYLPNIRDYNPVVDSSEAAREQFLRGLQNAIVRQKRR